MAVFAVQEYRNRIEAVKRRMERAGVEVLWVTSPPNMTASGRRARIAVMSGVRRGAFRSLR